MTTIFNPRTGHWFDSMDRIELLICESLTWVGTPFFPNSATKGIGACCHKLSSAIFRRIGTCDIEVPNVPMSHARFSQGHSLLEEFMVTRPEFFRTPLPVLPGDMLGFRLGKCIHHCGIALTETSFIHAMEHVGCLVSQLTDATWSTRLAAVWRPRP
jgi:cell wall-associated NlpC family hydrolase